MFWKTLLRIEPTAVLANAQKLQIFKDLEETLILFLKAEVMDAQYAHLVKCWTKTTYIVMASKDSVISEGPTQP